MKKRDKRLLIIAGILAGLFIGLLVAGTIIRKKIEKELADTRLGEFRFTCERVQVNLVRQSLTLRGVRLKSEERDVPPDSLLDKTVQYLDARIGTLTVRGISLKAIRNKDIELSNLMIDAPDITVVTRQMPDSVSSTENGASFRQLTIDAIGITNGTLDWRQITETDTLQCKVFGLNTQLDHLQIDSTRQSRERFLFSRNIEGSVQTLRYTFANSAYIFALDSLAWDYSGQLVSIVNAELLPQLSKTDFPRKSVRKSDYMQLDLKNLAITGLDFDHLWNEKEVRIDSVYASNGNFVSFKDRNAVVPQRIKPMMHTTIQNIPIPLSIRKIRLENTNATYEELAKYGSYAGAVTFNEIDATFLGFTNIVTRKDQYVELYAHSKVNGAGELTAVVSMPVDPTNDYFEAKATLVNVPMSALNRMVTPLAKMEIETGHIDRLDFTMAGSGRTARMDMILRYHDLKIGLLKREDRQWQQRTGLSNLVNWAIIHSDNPDKNGLRTAQTTVQRDVHRSVFNYLWKGISSGALETAETGTAKRLLGNK